jgi:Domain of unknown function (DUF4180)
LIVREWQRLLVAGEVGREIGRPQYAVDLMSVAWEHEVNVIAVPVVRFDAEFFRLRSGMAGEFIQKLVNYRCRLAMVGDLSEQIAASDAPRDFVPEHNRGTQLFFVADVQALVARLTATAVGREKTGNLSGEVRPKR